MTTRLQKIEKALYEGRCSTYNNWREATGMSAPVFLEAVEWVLSDQLNEKGLMTREAVLCGDGSWKKIERVYYADGSFNGFFEGNFRWNGEMFYRYPVNENEKYFVNEDGKIEQLDKIGINAHSRFIEPINLYNPLNEWMSKKGMNAYKLAEATGITYSSIHGLIKGDRKLFNVTIETAKKICDVLDVTLEDFFKGAELQKNDLKRYEKKLDRFKEEAEKVIRKKDTDND